MYVCICRRVTDRQVTACLERGASTLAEITNECGAGGDCGACRAELEDRLEAHAEARSVVLLRRPTGEAA